MKSKYIIPIFIPEEACPNRCVYCNQYTISSKAKTPSIKETRAVIDEMLKSMPQEAEKEIAFFGGNFTGIDPSLMIEYLRCAKGYIDRGAVNAVRVSTRPDYIDDGKLSLLKSFGVNAIELGAQSMDDGVLSASQRGHSAEETVRASKLITGYGFELGLQMMIGLPKDNAKLAGYTARRIVELKAKTTRIYPCLVLDGTDLHKSFDKGGYIPMSLTDAVNTCADIVPIFEEAGIRIMRVGLHPSEELSRPGAVIAGPYHSSFYSLVKSELWRRAFASIPSDYGATDIDIFVNPKEASSACGYCSSNKKFLMKAGKKLRLLHDTSLKGRDFYVRNR